MGKFREKGQLCVLKRTKKDILAFECPYKERRTKKDAAALLYVNVPEKGDVKDATAPNITPRERAMTK